MAFLPEQMPTEFKNTYKPISAAGTSQQLKVLARLLALQFKKNGLIQVKETTPAKSSEMADDAGNHDDAGQAAASKAAKSSKKETTGDSKVTRLSLSASSGPPVKPLPDLNSIVAKKKATSKTFKLSEVTMNASSDYSSQFLEETLYKTYKRVLQSEGIFRSPLNGFTKPEISLTVTCVS